MMAVRVRLILILAALAGFVGCGDRTPPPQASAKTSDAPPQSAPVLADDRPVIVTFGDSLTAGYGLDPAQSYPSLLQKELDAAGYRYRVVNLGVSGDTTTDGVERLPSVLSLRPAVVIVEFGANDGMRGQPVASAGRNLEMVIEAVQKAGAKVLLAGMTLPRNYGPEYIRAFDQIYPDLAKKYKVPRIPFLLDGVGGNPEFTQPDGLHPTAQGTEIVVHTVLRYLTPLLALPAPGAPVR